MLYQLSYELSPISKLTQISLPAGVSEAESKLRIAALSIASILYIAEAEDILRKPKIYCGSRRVNCLEASLLNFFLIFIRSLRG
jgi:hypothetical protein